MDETPVIPLRHAPTGRASWARPRLLVYLWALVEILFVTNPLQISSSLRVAILRSFGAEIGERVIFRPRTRVLFPWNLHIGDDCWIGDSVWFHNQDKITIGHDVVVSQKSFLTTGSHSHRSDMGLVTRPISIAEGAWVTSGSIVLGGSNIGHNAIVLPGAVVAGVVPPNTKFGPQPSSTRGSRFKVSSDEKKVD
jgi:putative colanic acid biosynthesis acetyltransferase WcaF